MVKKLASARKAVIEDAAHMANLDHPEVFRQIVTEILDEVLD